MPTAMADINGNNSRNNNNNNNNAERSAQRRAAVAAARGEVDRATTVMAAITSRVRATNRANPKFLIAETEMTDAREAYAKARQAVLKSMEQKPDYMAAVKEEADARARVAEEKRQTNAAFAATQPATQPASNDDASADPQAAPTDATSASTATLPDPTADQVDAAQDRMEIKTRLRQLQDAALSADPTAAAARVRLDAALSAMKVWQLQEQATLLNDPEYKAAVDQLAAARARVTQAAAQQ